MHPATSISIVLSLLLCARAHAGPEEVDVVGVAPDPTETSASVTVIPVDGRLSAADDVASAVARAPGVVITRLGGLGDYTTVSLRGSTAQQVEVFVDGVPLNPEGAAAVNLAELPLRAFSRVEVYRSGAPPELGSSPIGGVIHLVSADTPAREVSASAGSYGTTRVHAMALGAAADGRSDGLLIVETFSTQGNYLHLDDGGTPTTRIDDRLRSRSNNDKSQLSAHTRGRWGSRRLRLTLFDAVLARDVGVPGPTFAPSGGARFGVARNLLVAQVDSTQRVQATARVYGNLRQERLDDREGTIGVGSRWIQSGLGSGGVHGGLRGALLPWLVPGMAVDVRHDRFEGRDLVLDRAQPGVGRTRVGATGFADLWAGPLSVTPVVQGMWLNSRSLEDEAGIGAVLPRVGARLEVVPALQLRANAGRYLRPPDPTELFGDRGAIVGRPDLLPERGWQLDGGIGLGRPDGTGIDLISFWRQSEDLVAFVQNAQRVAVPVNIGRARVRGLEGAAGVSVGGWGLRVKGTRTWSEDAGENPIYAGNQLPRIPAYEVLSELGWASDQARFGYDLSATDGNYWDRTNWYRAAPRVLHGAFVRGHPWARGPWMELDVRNLTNRLAQVVEVDPLRGDRRTLMPVTDFVGYPLPGRTVLVTLRWEAS